MRGPFFFGRDALVELNSDEHLILTWSQDKTAQLWDAATGEPSGPALLHQTPVQGAMFNGDESRVLTWTWDNITLWNVATREPIGPSLLHQGAVEGALFNSDDSLILTWSSDNTTRLWSHLGPSLTIFDDKKRSRSCPVYSSIRRMHSWMCSR